jgi:hypothetical protein
MVRSTELGSSSRPSGKGFFGEALDLKNRSDSWVTMGGGDQKDNAP